MNLAPLANAAEPERDRRAVRAQVLHRDDGALRRRMVQATERRARTQVRLQFLLSVTLTDTLILD